jgi:hypothetical protein
MKEEEKARDVAAVKSVITQGLAVMAGSEALAAGASVFSTLATCSC